MEIDRVWPGSLVRARPPRLRDWYPDLVRARVYTTAFGSTFMSDSEESKQSGLCVKLKQRSDFTGTQFYQPRQRKPV